MRHALPASLLLAGCAMTPAPDNAAALSLAAAERAFAAQSMRSDMVSAFVANFADDGVLVTNGWTRAKTALAGKPPPPVDLDWAPAHVEVAASGELGLSTGPSIRKSRTHPEAAPSYGHFVSVWRRSPEGRWQVEVDLGISHPQAFALPGEAAVAPTAALADPAETLDQAEARFEQICAREGARAAFEASALPRFMLYRPAHAPVQGKAAALASPLLDTTRIAWRAEKVVASRADDFGYVRGTYAEEAGASKTRGYFLRIWRREGARWGIVLDVGNAAR